MISMPLVRDFVGSKSAADFEIRLAFNAAVSSLESRTGRLWSRREGYQQLIITNERSKVVWVRLYPIDGVTIKEWSESSVITDADDLSEDDFIVNVSTGRLQRVDAYWQKNVQVTITGGFLVDTLEGLGFSDVHYALLLQTRYALARNSPQRVAEASTATRDGGTATHLTGAFHKEFDEVCQRYSRRARN